MYDSSDYDSIGASTGSVPSIFDYKTEEMRTEDFLERLEKQGEGERGERLYWAAPLTSPSMVRFMRNEFKGWRGIWCGGDSAGRLEPSIWISGLGSATQLHYDVKDNVLCQVEGKKRVRVWRRGVKGVVMYPDAHGRARKAQRTLEDAGLPEPDVDVVIEGDTGVQIPAFCLHHAEVVEGPSVSVNVFGESGVGEAAGKFLGGGGGVGVGEGGGVVVV